MRGIWSLAFLFGVSLMVHCTPTLGGEDLNSIATQEPVPPVIDRSSHDHYESSHHEEPSFQGFWKKKVVWRPHWVKTWQPKTIYVAIWKKVWGPAVIKEWVPVPKPPPGWIKHEKEDYFVKGH